ncbi:hypothetical protein [Halobacillus sp. A5]|uniref:capsular polysaccharide export protein, LipB/KpsS family n=1 Tax=Halobacillus sp. A5 TaxID=2880263 RepID=UPI0020A6C1F0|nr:hypothetical protein [Halobacillus sp. A5]MCP3028401.1 hypothetical protein [Halobacillus sp. A5]
MNTYERNYWSLYLDFLDRFEGITYKGYSLPYLCHYRSLIKKAPLMNNLDQDSFTLLLNNKVESNAEIQSRFNRFIKKHTSSRPNKNKKGKVIIHDVYNLIRFPTPILNKYFSPSTSLIIKDRKKPPRDKGYVRKEKDGNIPVHYFDEYKSQSSTLEAAVTETHRQAKKIFKAFPNHPLFSDKKFQTIFLMQLEKIIHRIEQASRLFRSEPVSCVIVASTHYPESRTLAIVAAKQGVTSICMQHGIISSEFGYLPKIATVDAVYGTFEKVWYKQKGIADQAVEIIGHPRFDQITLNKPVSKNEFVTNLGLDPSKKTVLVVVRGNKDLQRWKVLVQALAKKGNANILIKDFPGSQPHQLTKDVPEALPTQNYSLYDILHNVDAVVVYSSTVGLEAMLSGKPVFILSEHFPGHTGYYYGLGGLTHDNPSKLANIVLRYFTDPQMENYEKKMREKFLSTAYNTKQLSGKRLLQLIDRLTK